MRVFCTVAESLRFRAAAQRHGISSAMVSKHIAALEQQIGARLLARNSRHVALTDEGQIYYQRAIALLEELDDLEASVGDRSRQISGVIRLSAPVWMANAKFAEILLAFTRSYPDVTFDVDLSAGQVNLVEDGYDLALRVSPKLDPGLIAKPLSSIRFGLYAAPGYITAHGAPRSIDQIFSHPMLVYGGATALEDVFGSRRRGQKRRQVKGLVRSENEVLLLHAAVAGLGLVVLPDWLANSEVASGTLVRLLSDEFDINVRLHAVYSSRRLLPARVRRFIDFLGPAP